MAEPAGLETIRRRLMKNSYSVCGVICLATVCLASLPPRQSDAQSKDPYASARSDMVKETIVREGVKNPAVLRAMRTVPRHKFIGPKNKPMDAYFDQALPIGHGQTISPPFIVAYMTESLDPQPTDRVLEIGTGSGYQAAVLSEIVKEVYTIEIVEQLGKNAGKVLKDYANVFPKIGDGFKGWPEKAPFDKIIVTCSPESVPQPLVDQLKEGGKLIVPLGERYEQVFYLFEKKEGKLEQTRLLPALFVPMTGEAEKNRQVQPDPKNPEIHNGSFEKDVEGFPIGWHYQRQVTLKEGLAPNGRHYVSFKNEEPGRNSQMLQAIPVDGRQVSALKVTITIKTDNVKAGENGEAACLLIRFYDSDRGVIKDDKSQVLGPWTGSVRWTTITKTIPVPKNAREGIFFLGLLGAVGEFAADDISVVPIHRK